MGKNIQEALANHKKVLLTATPLQNSLMELYGLASFIDDRIFGSVETFKATYINNAPSIEDLKIRLKPFVQRTLHRQVLEYKILRVTRSLLAQAASPLLRLVVQAYEVVLYMV